MCVIWCVLDCCAVKVAFKNVYYLRHRQSETQVESRWKKCVVQNMSSFYFFATYRVCYVRSFKNPMVFPIDIWAMEPRASEAGLILQRSTSVVHLGGLAHLWLAKQLVMANHSHTWWYNMSPLRPLRVAEQVMIDSPFILKIAGALMLLHSS